MPKRNVSDDCAQAAPAVMAKTAAAKESFRFMTVPVVDDRATRDGGGAVEI
ncbi:hypothetical protein PPGU16_41250 [Paraburkholderia largidicola]|uniref:Uncharacterized protein n=1 Tax=Paraburkholderia largidicola TaxID=3014751 RepID=A0A7I8BRY5_9BURK|nr:hypothetical protein PPGU16_41250 [Paraburkholderia sp. PGU16]